MRQTGVVKVKPHDKDAEMKYQECNKIVKQKAFEQAIAGDEHKRSVVDSLDIESMSKSGPGALCSSPEHSTWARSIPWGGSGLGGSPLFCPQAAVCRFSACVPGRSIRSLKLGLTLPSGRDQEL
ncbi:protein PPP5D1 [Sapajus apella]|uniref:Protein PPP5D1 n=1 Tax=Sapajus apella TaxID=9515 RepID=A0A6J3GKM7_SAPAP|nr:protein PPP5D1 [Sapajus apella]